MLGMSWDISIIGVSLSIFTFANILIKPRKGKTDFLLIGWLLILNAPMLHIITEQLHFYASQFRLFTNPSFNLLHGPILYYYVLLLVKKSVKFKPLYILHLLPFALLYAIYFSSPHPFMPMLPSPSGHPLPFHHHGHPAVSHENWLVSLPEQLLMNFGLINITSFLIYSLLVVILLIQHQKRVRRYFSQRNSRITLQWLYLIPTVFIILMLFNLANELGLLANFSLRSISLHLISNFLFTLLLCFFGVKQEPVFKKESRGETTANNSKQGDQQALQESRTGSQSKVQTETLSVDRELMDKAVMQLNQYMQDNKPYLDPNLSIYGLAEAMNMPRQTVSQAINIGLSKNFFQYINEYRIAEAQARLVSEQDKHLTILDIALDSGFNSKSSFYKLFKEYCHLTPLQYRKSFMKA